MELFEYDWNEELRSAHRQSMEVMAEYSACVALSIPAVKTWLSKGDLTVTVFLYFIANQICLLIGLDWSLVSLFYNFNWFVVGLLILQARSESNWSGKNYPIQFVAINKVAVFGDQCNSCLNDHIAIVIPEQHRWWIVCGLTHGLSWTSESHVRLLLHRLMAWDSLRFSDKGYQCDELHESTP